MAQLARTQAFEDYEYDSDESYDEYREREIEEMKRLVEESDEHPFLAFGAADGYALYRVLEWDPLTLQHVPYGDGYAIPGAHVRGLRKQDVEMHKIEEPKEWFMHLEFDE